MTILRSAFAIPSSIINLNKSGCETTNEASTITTAIKKLIWRLNGFAYANIRFLVSLLTFELTTDLSAVKARKASQGPWVVNIYSRLLS